MTNMRVRMTATRYEYEELPFGIAESQPLDFHTPYGCSKGAGDQYVRDYNRIYGLRTVVFRQSCIYGYRQFGVEDQGWLAHFAISALTRSPITIYGDGRQVRDVLFIDDLVRAMQLAIERIDVTAGQIYNLGGGPENVLSIWTDTEPILRELSGQSMDVKWGPWRPGDQLVYISDIRKAQQDFGWRPRVSPRCGIQKMWQWVVENRDLFDGVRAQ
jgi:CDP-paratose 2-epimerase